MKRAREYLEEIEDLYRSGPFENGPDLLDRVTDLYFVTLEQQSPDDLDAFGDIMARIAFAGDALSRARLAERIALAELAPLELLLQLARDEICVARPVLQYSPCLREGDLVSITSDVEQSHLMATAHRIDLTTPVTDILVDRGGPEVHIAVVSNASAELSPESIGAITAAAGLDENIRRAMNRRRDMAPRPIQRLKRLADAEFWQKMGESLLMTSEESEPPMPSAPPSGKRVEAGATVTAPRKPKPEQPVELKPANPAAEKYLVESAKAGDMEKTIASFSKIANLDEGLITHCLFQAHVSALMVLCKAHRLAPSTFTSLLQLRESRTGNPLNDTIGLIRRYEGMTPDTAQRIIRFSNKRRTLEAGQKETDAA